MATLPQDQITILLQRWRSGDESALHELMPLVYRELKRTARAYLSRERHAQSWQPTILVNEAFLRLIACRTVEWHDRAHFFRLSARKMREILVDYVRKKRFKKKGGGDLQLVPIEEGVTEGPQTTKNPVDVILLNDALDRLEMLDPRKVQIVEMRFFTGLSIEEIGQALSPPLAPATIHRELRLARVWLFRAMQEGKKS